MGKRQSKVSMRLRQMRVGQGKGEQIPEILGDSFEAMPQNELDAVSVRRLSIHITDRCNLHCDFCGFESGPSRTTELSLIALRRLEVFAKSMKIPLVEVSGGEPLLHSRFWEVLDLFRSVRFVGLITNGTLIGSNEAALLSTYRLNAVKISFDHDRLNDQAIRAARYMVQNGIRVKTLVTVTKFTTPNDVMDTIRTAHKVGAWRAVLRAVEPNGRAARDQLPKKEVLEAIATKVLKCFESEFLEFSCGFEFVGASCNYPSSTGDRSNITAITNGDLFYDHCEYTAAIRGGKAPEVIGNILTNILTKKEKEAL